MNVTALTGIRLGWTRMQSTNSLDLVDGFIAAYINAFAGPPYFETYGIEEVYEEVLLPHLRDGVVVVMLDSQRDFKVVGFGCAMPFDKSPDDVKEHLECLHRDGALADGFDHRQAWYMSELGVLEQYRGHGIGYEMVLQRTRLLEELGASQFFMRTAAEGSNSKHMYLKIGAQPIAGQQDVSSTDQATENHTQSLERVYLWGDCQPTTQNIERIKAEHGYPKIQMF